VRLVLDCDTVVAAMRSPGGASAALLRRALDGDVTLLANVALVLEYEAVCRRPEHVAASGLKAGEVDVFVVALAALVEPIETHFVWRPQLRDPSDEMVLEAAVNGHADAIVSFNLRDYGTAPQRFGIALWLPRDAIRRARR
jgi:putative PIN family toxin of toxin-antitoxin system